MATRAVTHTFLPRGAEKYEVSGLLNGDGNTNLSAILVIVPEK